jgi:hypothetical protein
MSHQHGDQKSEHKKQDAQPSGALLQHIGGLSTEHLVGHAAAKSCAKSFLTRTLHEHDEDEEGADNAFQHHEKSDKNVHKGWRLWHRCLFTQEKDDFPSPRVSPPAACQGEVYSSVHFNFTQR